MTPHDRPDRRAIVAALALTSPTSSTVATAVSRMWALVAVRLAVAVHSDEVGGALMRLDYRVINVYSGWYDSTCCRTAGYRRVLGRPVSDPQRAARSPSHRGDAEWSKGGVALGRRGSGEEAARVRERRARVHRGAGVQAR